MNSLQNTKSIHIFEIEGVKVDIVNYPYKWLEDPIEKGLNHPVTYHTLNFQININNTIKKNDEVKLPGKPEKKID